MQVIPEFFPAGVKEAVSEVGADAGSTKMYKINFSGPERGNAKLCLLLLRSFY